MFDLDKAITTWRRQMAAEGLISTQVLDELESHLREEIERRMQSGAIEERAFQAGISSIGDISALKVEFAKLNSTRRGSRKTLQAFYFGSIIFLVLVNAWNLLEVEIRPTARFAGILAVCLLGSYLACLPYLLRSISDSSYDLLTKGIKLASNLVWLWPAWALLQAAHVVNSELGLVPMTVLLCLCSAIGLSVVAYALSEPSRRTGGSGNPPWPLPCSGQPIPPTRPATPDPIVQQSFEIACEEAARLGHDYVGTEHMLLGLLKLTKGSFADLLRSLNLDSDLVRTQIERIVTPILVRPGTAELPLTPRARKALKIAIKEAKAQTHLGMRAEHIFLGLLLEGSGVAARALKNLGVRTEKVREAIGVNELRAD